MDMETLDLYVSCNVSVGEKKTVMHLAQKLIDYRAPCLGCSQFMSLGH